MSLFSPKQRAHLKSLDVPVQALAVVPHGLEAKYVAIVLNEPGPPAVVHRVAQGCLRKDFHVVLLVFVGGRRRIAGKKEKAGDFSVNFGGRKFQ